MRVYFDENFSPHLVAGMRSFQEGRASEGVAVSSIAEEFHRGAADEIWIPGVASRHGVALLQDLNIHRMLAQWELCRQNKIGLFFFRPPRKEGWSYWSSVQLVVRVWPELIEAARVIERPFGFVIEANRPKLKPI